MSAAKESTNSTMRFCYFNISSKGRSIYKAQFVENKFCSFLSSPPATNWSKNGTQKEKSDQSPSERPTLPKTKIKHLKMPKPKRKGWFPNHKVSGGYVSFRKDPIFLTDFFQVSRAKVLPTIRHSDWCRGISVMPFSFPTMTRDLPTKSQGVEKALEKVTWWDGGVVGNEFD